MTIEKEIELPGRIIIYIKYFRNFSNMYDKTLTNCILK